VPDVEVKIAENGEVMYRSPGVFVGYNKNKQATPRPRPTTAGCIPATPASSTMKAICKIIDRAKDVGKLKGGGSLFAPKYIENKLKFFPNIKEAVAFGDGGISSRCSSIST
jgi:long-chain acyl-CoA synthetase